MNYKCFHVFVRESDRAFDEVLCKARPAVPLSEREFFTMKPGVREDLDGRALKWRIGPPERESIWGGGVNGLGKTDRD